VADLSRHPTPLLYAGLMLGAGVLALLGAWGAAGGLAGASAARLAMACTAFGVVLSVIPALVGPRREVGNWGLVVLGSSMARLILMLSLGLALAPEAGARPFWLGVVAGAGTLLVCETGAAAFIITRLEQLRAARPGAEQA
jgi:hypothetical protein